MPYKHSEKGTLLKRENDRRVKLTEQQRHEIKINELGLSQRALSAEYGVSRRLIQFILDPSKHEENVKRRKEREVNYYDREKHKEYMKDHRRYKQKIHMEGGTYRDDEIT